MFLLHAEEHYRKNGMGLLVANRFTVRNAGMQPIQLTKSSKSETPPLADPASCEETNPERAINALDVSATAAVEQ